jgi:hypothetical protein
MSSPVNPTTNLAAPTQQGNSEASHDPAEILIGRGFSMLEAALVSNQLKEFFSRPSEAPATTGFVRPLTPMEAKGYNISGVGPVLAQLSNGRHFANITVRERGESVLVTTTLMPNEYKDLKSLMAQGKLPLVAPPITTSNRREFW